MGCGRREEQRQGPFWQRGTVRLKAGNIRRYVYTISQEMPAFCAAASLRSEESVTVNFIPSEIYFLHREVYLHLPVPFPGISTRSLHRPSCSEHIHSDGLIPLPQETLLLPLSVPFISPSADNKDTRSHPQAAILWGQLPRFRLLRSTEQRKGCMPE